MDEVIRISIGLRYGSNLCEPYVCTCAKFVKAKGLHSFSCKKSSGKIARRDLLNNIILRAIQSAKIPAKEPLVHNYKIVASNTSRRLFLKFFPIYITYNVIRDFRFCMWQSLTDYFYLLFVLKITPNTNQNFLHKIN